MKKIIIKANYFTTKADTIKNNNTNTEKKLSELEGFNFEDNQIFNLNKKSSPEAGLVITYYPLKKVEKNNSNIMKMNENQSSNINKL